MRKHTRAYFVMCIRQNFEKVTSYCSAMVHKKIAVTSTVLRDGKGWC